MSPLDFSTGIPTVTPPTRSLGIVGHAGALHLPDAGEVRIDTTAATDLACAAVPELRAVARLAEAARDVLCPMHEVSMLVTHFIGAVAAVPPDYSPSHPLNGLSRLGHQRHEWERYGQSPDFVDRVISDLSDEPMVRCLCPEGTPEPPLTYINAQHISSGAVARLAQPLDEHALGEWTQIRMDVEMRWLEPRIAVLAKMLNRIVPEEHVVKHDNRMDALAEWQPDVEAVLTTLVGRKRWNVRGGWTDRPTHWPLALRPSATSDRLDQMLRADECLHWIRKQFSFKI